MTDRSPVDLLIAAEQAEQSGFQDQAERLFAEADWCESVQAWSGKPPVFAVDGAFIMATHAAGPCPALYLQSGAADLDEIARALTAMPAFLDDSGAVATPSWTADSEYLYGPQAVLLSCSGYVHTAQAARLLSAWAAGWRPAAVPSL